jgi:hypothetical protein
MATISGVARPAYVYDAANSQWVPIGVGPHTHSIADLPSVVSTTGGSTIAITQPSVTALRTNLFNSSTVGAPAYEVYGDTGELRFRIDNTGGIVSQAYSSDSGFGVAGINVNRFGTDPVGAIGLNGAAGTITTPQAVTAGMRLGLLSVGGHDGTAYRNSSRITFYVDAAVATGSVPGSIAFNTVRVGESSHVERMRLDNAGNLRIGDVSAVNTLRYFDLYNTSTGNDAGTIIRFITNNADNSGVTTVDMVKYRAGGAFVINNNQFGGYTAFNVGGTERMRINADGVNTSTGFVGPLVGGTSLTGIIANNTVFAANTDTLIGRFPYTTPSGAYAIRVAWGYGDNNAGSQLYWETNFSGITGVASAGGYFNGSPRQEVVMYGTHHHSNVAVTSNPRFFLSSDLSNNPQNGYGALALYIRFPQITKIDGFTIQIKRLI